MRATYAQLYLLNGSLISEYSKRAGNHEQVSAMHATCVHLEVALVINLNYICLAAQLLAALKEVNHMIQKAAKLRVGAPKARVVSSCRAAIKANNIQSLFKIIATGRP